MSVVLENIKKLYAEIEDYPATLVAISKTKPASLIREAYDAGHLDFGENKVQELVEKQEVLPKDTRWHMVGHLQRNKVKYIAPFIHLIHSADSEKLIREINKEAKKNNRVISCLLQVHIAEETTKFGFDRRELFEFLESGVLRELENVKVSGLMGMATFTEDPLLVEKEFTSLKELFEQVKAGFSFDNLEMKTLSMGMSGDYRIALKCGSTLIRVGSAIFGERNYA